MTSAAATPGEAREVLCRPPEATQCPGGRPVPLLLRIEQPGRMPLYVKRLHQDGGVSVTFKPAEARRFSQADAEALRQADEVAGKWPEPGRAVYVPEVP